MKPFANFFLNFYHTFIWTACKPGRLPTVVRFVVSSPQLKKIKTLKVIISLMTVGPHSLLNSCCRTKQQRARCVLCMCSVFTLLSCAYAGCCCSEGCPLSSVRFWGDCPARGEQCAARCCFQQCHMFWELSSEMNGEFLDD